MGRLEKRILSLVDGVTAGKPGAGARWAVLYGRIEKRKPGGWRAWLDDRTADSLKSTPELVAHCIRFLRAYKGPGVTYAG